MNTPDYGNTGWCNSGYFRRPSLFGNGIGGWLLGGLLFSGLFGMMFGGGLGGFGGFGGIFSLLIQLGVHLLRRALAVPPLRLGPGGGRGLWRRHDYNYAPRQDWQPTGGSYGYGQNSASNSRGRDEIGVSNADLNTFEQRLQQLQDAYSREDYDALRRITHARSHELSDRGTGAGGGQGPPQRGVRRQAARAAMSPSAWREGSDEYATVAMRYESRDVMRNRATGELVSGEDRVVERSEVWTFVRHNRGEWLLSAIQGA